MTALAFIFALMLAAAYVVAMVVVAALVCIWNAIVFAAHALLQLARNVDQ